MDHRYRHKSFSGTTSPANRHLRQWHSVGFSRQRCCLPAHDTSHIAGLPTTFQAGGSISVGSGKRLECWQYGNHNWQSSKRIYWIVIRNWYRDFLKSLGPVAAIGLFVVWAIFHWRGVHLGRRDLHARQNSTTRVPYCSADLSRRLRPDRGRSNQTNNPYQNEYGL